MFDFDKQFEDTKNKIIDSVQKLFPRKGKIRTVRLKKVWVEDKLTPHDYQSQYEAKLKERTWAVPVYGNIELVDNASGKVIDTEEKVRLAVVPKMTDRGSFIVNGNEYQVQNMVRLKPGVYTIIQNNGLLDSWVNLAKGKNFNVMLDPQSGLFTAKIGTANAKLYPLLLGLGVNKADIEKAWGKELTDHNSKKSNYDSEILKAHKAFLGQPAADVAEALANLTTYFSGTEISKETTVKTLGRAFSKVDADLLLETTKKVLAVSRGTQKTDDRDALEFKTFHSVEDLLPERLVKTSNNIARAIDRNIDRRDKIRHIVSADMFGNSVETFFTGSDEFSGLAQVTPQTNPLSMLSETSKTTMLGPGGIPSVHSITMESRAVNPTSFGFIDPVHTPEGDRVGTSLHIAGAQKIGNDLFITLVNPKTMKNSQLNPSDMAKVTVAFRDQYDLVKGKLVPKSAKIKAIRNGEFVEVARKDVDYVFPSAKMFFDINSNMVPFLPTDQGNRAMMASKMLDQALPLLNREVPLVQTNLSRGITYPKIMGDASSRAAPVDGTVTKVTPDEIRIKDNRGKTVSATIFNKFPLNSQVYLQSDPRVKVGDKVRKGDLLADTNYTKDGIYTTGTNLSSVTADTLVFVYDANDRPRLCEIGQLLPKVGLKADTINEEAPFKRETLPISKFIAHEVDEGVLAVKTWSGREIKATESHSFIVLENGKLVKKKPGDLACGACWLPRIVSLPVNSKELTGINLASERKEDLVVKLTEDFGKLVGFYLAEGHVSQNKTISFAACDLSVREYIATAASACGFTPVFKETTVNIYDARLALHLKKEAGHLAENKKMPDYIWASPRNIREALLGAYWAGDGTVNVKTGDVLELSCSSASKLLRDGLSLLCTTLGIDSTVMDYLGQERDDGSRYKHCWMVRIATKSHNDFPRIFCDRKEKILRDGVREPKFDMHNMIPLWGSVNGKLLSYVTKKFGSKKRAGSCYSNCGASIRRGFIPRKLLLDIFSDPPIDSELLTLWAIAKNETLAWDRVASVTPVEYQGMVYDFEMGANPNFAIANGIVVHNTAYVPYKGYNFEDGIVISEGASRKLTSMHMHQESVDIDQGVVLNLKKFRAYYPDILDVEASKKFDDDGVIKVGQRVKFGDVIIAALKLEEAGTESEMLRKLHRAFVQPYKNASVTWQDEDEAIVVDVSKQPKKVTVYMTTEETAKIGDKLSSRHAAKGVITRIIPDAEMPKTKDGKPVEILLNPNGIVGRINLGQMLETAAGKIADKTGKPYIVDNFSGENYTNKVLRDLKAAGLKDKEDLFDPGLNKTIPNVLVGKQYIMKLDHPTRKKFSARSTGGYTMDLQPPSGGGEGGQSIGKMEFAALLAHGAKENLKEMSTSKSERNDEYWRFLQTGNPLPAPQVPFAFQKLEAMLKGSGIDVVKDGNKLQLEPLTDKQILEMSNGEVKDALAVRAKDLRPERGGIFDPVVTGGTQGKYWNHFKLAEPVPNPVFEMPIRELLGLTEAAYREYVDGQKWVGKDGSEAEKGARGAVTGGAAIKILLSNINVDKELQTLKSRAPGLRGSELEKINRKIRYLSALKEKKMSPSDYVIENFPMVPAVFRPIYALPNGNLGTSQVNELYRDTILVSNQMKDKTLPEDLKMNLRRDMYDGLKGIVGLGSGLTGRKRKGFIEQIAGDSPKTGFFQSKIMGRRQEFSGRSTVIPEPSLGLDEIALPEQMAWKLYEAFIIRELVQMGYTPLKAKEHLKERNELARKALESVMKDRPVMMNRAPTLHKFSIMALKPTITSGKAIKTNPLIIQGFNMDFDGDTASIHLPITEEARKETFKMLPSANLFSPRDGSLMNLPAQEAVLGLYLMTSGGKQTKARFKNLASAISAYKKKKYALSDVVSVAGKKMTLGQAIVNSVLPKEYRTSGLIATKKNLAKLLNKLAKDKPQVFASVVSKLKDMGNEYAYSSGFSVGLDDLNVDSKARDKIFAAADKRAKKVGVGQAYGEAVEKIDKWLGDEMSKSNNPFYQMVVSGARGNMSQLRQIVAAPVLVKDMNDQLIPVPIKHSFAEGLPIGDYLATMPGARKGIIDKSLMTSKPGAFSKELVQAAIQERVTIQDCGTRKGIRVSVNDAEALDRYLAVGVRGVASRNALVTSNLITKLRGKVKTITVRSPLTCEAPDGVCQLCYGIDEHGKKVELGRNVGVLAAQTITEPMSQMTLRTFHTGSVAEVGKRNLIGGFKRVKELLEMTDIVRNKASLAEVDGRVEGIKRSPAGGFEIMINGREHFVDPGRTPTVKIGQTVKKGDLISDGVVKPQELLQLKGVEATRGYLVDEIKKEFDAQNIKIKNKIFETAIRPLVNIGQVIDPGDSTYSSGDITTLSAIGKFNRGKSADSQIKFEPRLRGVNTYPLVSNDWLTRLNYQQLAKTITQGAAQGWKSDIMGAPVPAYAYGALAGREKRASEEPIEAEFFDDLSLEDQDIPEIIEAHRALGGESGTGYDPHGEPRKYLVMEDAS